MNPEATLNQLKKASPEGKLPSSYGVYFKNTLVALCHALEDHILQNNSTQPEAKPLVLVTFQQGKWYLQEADRYQQIAECSSHVMIAAVPDSGLSEHPTSQLDNVSLVNLETTDSLVNEWNLIILAPTYRAMVLCHELSDDEYLPHGKPTVDIERKFYGLWTFEHDLVEKAAKILTERCRPYDPALADAIQKQHQEIIKAEGVAPTDMSDVVSRIVSYLQTTQEQMIAINRQTRELWELEGQALRVSRNLNANKLQAFLRMAQKVDEQDETNPIASLQVAALSETLGQMLDLPTLKLRRLRLAGLLFRVGLVSAPKEVFMKTPNELDDKSLNFWQEKSVLGAQLLAAMPELAPVTNIIAHHLECWDGSGKPDGLRAEEIPIESRILGLVSYFQELTQPRGGRAALGLGEALAICSDRSGTYFEPALVETLSNVIRLTEMGLMELPERPRQLPNVWLEEAVSVKTPVHN
ncbi:DICT sensory domain-containing protein [Okeania sp.]|uniref:DICT sensory domain-containing protein n=1 Tax=Okeania sp. TaxID=3100323 RepID=UPI002B4B07D7|nr:HD domain-containing phosphohydrolase [Okeania sp.]MEB3340677.1 HD domain-containing phosphohydrolase [Okeania sp.]